MPGNSRISMRDAEERDGDLLLEWANDPEVRQSAFNSNHIAIDEHRAWLTRQFADTQNCMLFIAQDATGDEIGQVRFNRGADGDWYIDYSLAARMRGKGLATEMIGLAVDRLEDRLGPSSIKGLVKADNVRSAKVFSRLNFQSAGRGAAGELVFKRSARATIVIASPHDRNSGLIDVLSARLGAYSFRLVKSPEELLNVGRWQHGPDWIFFPHWSWLVPDSLYSRFRCVIFHMTDLPYGRGGSPLQNLIVRGHADTKISAIRCEKGLDTGDVYLKSDLSLSGTAEQILSRANNVIESMIERIIADDRMPVPQQGEVTTFARRKPEDGNLGSLKDIDKVYDYIRMLDGAGYPPAYASIGQLRIEFSDATLADGYVDARVRIRIASND